MKKYITDERTGLQYELAGAHYLPAGEDEPEHRPLGIWGQRRKRFLREIRRGIYEGMLLTGKLDDHLTQADRQAEEILFQLAEQMSAAQGITEEVKAVDRMAWVGAMNNIHAAAREIVERELTFV